MEKIFAMPAVAKHIPRETPVQNIPMRTMKGFYLDLFRFSFAESAKYGEMGRWPATHLFRQHFLSFLEHGFEGHREPLDVKFDVAAMQRGSHNISAFSVGYIDGQNKAIIMLSIMALLIEIETQQLL